MELAKVIGTLVSTHKVSSLNGIKLLLVQPLNENLEPFGEASVATDATYQAGIGEIVFIESGKEAAMALPVKFNPSDLSIIGIVDHVYS
ncbi:MAG: EutN/CcmL family microcompartment protein [Candidatus Sericytochromatia bacterium]|nr:EutN/CcmL family microcompartment protein [Candidatus Sericytochromatia bacterium]